MKNIENSMVAYARERKDPCPECRSKGFIYKYDEESGRSKRVDCENCDGGYITVQY